MLYFRGNSQESAIRLEWATGTEFDTVGFMIERALSSSGPYIVQDTIGFVPSAGSVDGLSGAEYAVVDANGILDGVTYWYQLIEIERDGRENRSEFISVTAGTQQDTTTSIATSAPTITTGETSQSSPEANATPSPSATNESQSGTASQITPTPNRTRSNSSVNSINRSQNPDTTDLDDSGTSGNSVSNRTSDLLQLTATPANYPAPESPDLDVSNLGESLESYPAPPLFDDLNVLPAYPPVNRSFDDGRRSPGLGDIDASQLVATRIGNSPYGPSDTSQGNSTQKPVNTILLWVGFLASFMIFIAGVVGSTYYYRRQNPK